MKILKWILIAVGGLIAIPAAYVAYDLVLEEMAMDLVCIDEVIERTPSPTGMAEALVLERNCRGVFRDIYAVKVIWRDGRRESELFRGATDVPIHARWRPEGGLEVFTRQPPAADEGPSSAGQHGNDVRILGRYFVSIVTLSSD